MGLAASWERQDAGSIPSLAAWWVKDLVFPQLQLRSQLWLRSDPWLGNPLCCGVAEKEKKKKRERERGRWDPQAGVWGVGASRWWKLLSHRMDQWFSSCGPWTSSIGVISWELIINILFFFLFWLLRAGA